MVRVEGELETLLLLLFVFDKDRESSEMLLESGEERINHPGLGGGSGDEYVLLGGFDKTWIISE